MDFKQFIINTYLRNYANFEGRASKSQFWCSMLFNLIAFMAIIFLAILLGVIIHSIKNAMMSSVSHVGTDNYVGLFMLLGIIVYAIAFTLPNIAVSVRRLHDTGKGGQWFFISLVPYLGFIWLLILCSLKGEDKPNRFGEIPFYNLEKPR